MKRFALILFCLFLIANVFAQRRKKGNESGVITCSEFHITRPLSDIFSENPVDEKKIYKKKESEDRENRKPQKFRYSVKDGPQYGNDERVMQRRMGDASGRAPIANWGGQTASGFRPFDPSGASGPAHYVQMINSTTFKVYNKTSGAVLLTGALGSLWAPATPDDGDPIVMYDKAADRWFLAQFGQTGNKIYIAVSTSGDPTGTYYTYTFSSPQFPDYLKFSVWADGYYMTSNQATQKVFVFERALMLAGNAGARAVYTTFSPPDGSGFFVPLPGDAADGMLPSAGTPCPIFSYSDNGWGAGYSDAVNIYQMSTNWAAPSATITLAGNIPTAAFDATYDVNWNDVSQPGTTQKLDGIGGVCMYRAQWKSWSGYNTVLLNWGVKISATQRSIKWCELRQDQTSGTWSLYQEGIYTPDAATRWMGGIAMDNNGSIGLCYIKSDAASIYPGLYYTGRRSCDPPGTLPIVETTVIAGTGSQTGVNRVGDYAHLALDPDGITFWHTSEFMGGATGGSAARTRIFSFQLPSCNNIASVYIVQTAGTNPSCTGSLVTFTATPDNGGTTPAYQWQVDGANAGTNSATFSTSSLTNGQVVTCIMTSNLAGVTGSPATSNAITMAVNAPTPASVVIAASASTVCSGTSVTFTATPTNGGASPSYQWKVNGANAGTNSPVFTTSSLTNGQVVTCVMTSNSTCVTTPTATSNSITMTIVSNGTPSISISTGSSTICSGTSALFTATPVNGGVSPSYQWKINGANAGTNSPTFTTSALTNGQIVTCVMTSIPVCPTTVTLGTGTGLNATTSDVAAAYPTYYGNGRQQYLIRASELTGLGLTAGKLTSIGFNVAGATGDPVTLNGYTIKIGTTSATATTINFQPTTSTVYGPVNYTPALSTINTHNFSTPFAWNGSSNIIIDICFSNQVVGTLAYQNYFSTTSYRSTTYYQADGSGGAGACTQPTGTRAFARPNMTLTDAIPSNSTSNGITMTVNANVTPSVAIALTSGTNPECAGASTTFTATPTNGGASPFYQWQVNLANAGTNSPTFTSSTLTNGQTVRCIMTSNATCASPASATSTGITMVVISPTTWYADTDVDGYGSPASSIQACTQPGGYVGDNTDCNDADAAVNPAHAEVCGNNIDDNCNTQVDEGCLSTLNLKLFLQGYYIGLGQMEPVLFNQLISPNPGPETDTIYVELHDGSLGGDPDVVVAADTAVVMTNGTVTCTFPSTLVNGNNLWIVVKHRNSVETWSMTAVAFGAVTGYDFTTSQSKAFDNNMIDVFAENIWELFTGDINQDGFIDANDYPAFDNDNFNSIQHIYVATDMNGDGFVDANDYPIFDNNNFNSVQAIHP